MIKLFKQQPRAFYMIFFLELWERFGYYTVQGILAYFFVKSLGFSEDKAFFTFGAFSALVYGLVAFGGYIGDKVIGTKRSIVIGIQVLAIGYLCLAFATKETVFLALGIICVGNGLFKANPSSLLAKCYEENDPRLHGAFTLYYMAINIGSLFALIIGPTIAAKYDWHYAFFLSFLGMVMALVNYWFYRHTVSHVDSEAGDRELSLVTLNVVLIGILGACLASAYLLQHVNLAQGLLWLVTVLIVATYLKYTFKEEGLSRKKMLVALVLMIEAIVFFTLYQQMPTSINFFAIHNVEHVLFGIKIDPQSFQALNPLWIMVMSPLLAWVYLFLHRNKKDMSTANKFALGMTLCGISFTILFFSRYFADDQGIVSSWWLVASYFFQSIGELLVSALGVAMVAELVPQSIVGFIMGMWFLTSSIAGFTGAYVASLTSKSTTFDSGMASLTVYSEVFLKIGLVTLGIALLMWIVAPYLNRYIKQEQV